DAVVSLRSDRSGRLWAGTGSGIVRYEGGKWIACPKSDGQPLRNASRILEAEDGRILAVSGNHLYRLSGQVFSALPDPPRIAYLHVLPVPGLGLSASAREHFGRFRDGRWQEVALAPGMTPASRLGTTRGPRQSIWAVSTDSVRKYENGV